MATTDYLKLGEHKIFREVFAGLPKSIDHTLSLLAVRDGVLYTWDLQNNCVLSLNVKAARTRIGDNVQHQKLLPLHPPLFTPERLIANESNSLVAVSGPNGVLVLELPARTPPLGAFDNNKELVYCRSHSLDERLLACSESVEVRQVKFHPGCIKDRHVLVLTSDNNLRLYQIKNNEAINLAVYSVGKKPMGIFPGTKTHFLDLYGEVAVDFDFGQPEIARSPLQNNSFNETEMPLIVKKELVEDLDKTLPKEEEKWASLDWPVFVLRGDCTVFTINISLHKKGDFSLKGPLPMISGSFEPNQSEACSIICLNSLPQIVCIAMSNGTLCHSILMDLEEKYLDKLKRQAKVLSSVPTKELYVFETVELELGLATCEEDNDTSYKCPIFLLNDDCKVGRYFATHNAGVHAITIESLADLQSYLTSSKESSDLFTQSSTAEYMVCTKTMSSEKLNPVIGFAMNYEPSALIALLSNASLVTFAILTTTILPILENSQEENKEVVSPLKKMLKEPFDQYIEKILKKTTTQPVLKLNPQESSNKQCYELLQRTSQAFRDDYFKHHTKAREEIEKRIQTLTLMKTNQLKEVQTMSLNKQNLQITAENLAEKYEDIRDKQDELVRRCETLLLLVSQTKPVPSDAETEFLKKLNEASDKMTKYTDTIDKVKTKMKYQEVQMAHWKEKDVQKTPCISEIQSNTIKNNLQDTTKKIAKMVHQVNEYKKKLNLC